MTDVIVVGGGVIGLSIAYELAGQGVSVSVFDQGPFGREASWAGAGILPPGNPEKSKTAFGQLRAFSHHIWPNLSEQLFEETGIDNGFRNCGGIAVSLRDDDLLDETIDFWRQEGIQADPLTKAELLKIEPAVGPEIAAACRVPEMSQVRNPRHLKALVAGCAARGVDLHESEPIVGFEIENSYVSAVRTASDTYRAGQFCVTGGAWTKQLLAGVGVELHIEPVRGQIVLFSVQPVPFQHVIELGSQYLVPRSDGRILAGSTEDHVGFDHRTTAAGIRGLIDLALTLVPTLADATVERTWAGLRPSSADGMPYLGRVPTTENMFVAAGHFRSGLQMSPATALVMRQLILGQETAFALDALGCERHQSAADCAQPHSPRFANES